MFPVLASVPEHANAKALFEAIYNGNAGWVKSIDAMGIIKRECERLGVRFASGPSGTVERLFQANGATIPPLAASTWIPMERCSILFFCSSSSFNTATLSNSPVYEEPRMAQTNIVFLSTSETASRDLTRNRHDYKSYIVAQCQDSRRLSSSIRARSNA